jgi:ThiF family
MSQQLISRSPDLKRLRDEGYDIKIIAGHVVVRDVPYVSASKEIKRANLAAVLKLAGDVTDRPDDHVAKFSGDHPCDKDGREIEQIRHNAAVEQLAPGLTIQRTFSAKGIGEGGHYQYADFYEKMTRYVGVISSPAEAIDPAVTARTYPVVEPDDDEDSVFNYVDTASSRAGTVMATRKLELSKVAIVGLGGTGSYILDLVAKTPVREIHLFDADTFSQHNAFRAPGAASKDELLAKPLKVAYLAARYAPMRKCIMAHEAGVTPDNVGELRAMDFVFLCLDNGAAKRLAIEHLRDASVPFSDCGVGLYLTDDSIGGHVRVTTGSKLKSDHVETHVPFSDGDARNEYAQNIQVADLNALNAALAVIRWKKLFGFYQDLEREHNCVYTFDGNHLSNSDSL